MSKKLNITAITNDLSQGSAFFRPSHPQLPKTQAGQPPPPESRPEARKLPPPLSPIQNDKQQETPTLSPQKPDNEKAPSVQEPKDEKFDKYSTYLRPGYKKELKMTALERDCKDYEILDEALSAYFKNLKK